MSDIKNELLNDETEEFIVDGPMVEPEEVEIIEEPVVREKDEDDEEIVEGTKPLIPGKTPIGKINGKVEGQWRELTILYGNVATPVIKNNFIHLKNDVYMEMLVKFLESEEGLEYIAPSEEEVNRATLHVLNIEEQVKNKEKEETMKQPIIEDDTEEIPVIKDEEEFIEEPVGRKSAPAEQGKFKLISAILAGLLLLSVLGNTYFLTNKKEAVYEYGELDINGEVYKVPVADMTVADEQTKLMIYGLSVTNHNGETTRKAIPLGELKFNGISFESMLDAEGKEVEFMPEDQAENPEENGE